MPTNFVLKNVQLADGTIQDIQVKDDRIVAVGNSLVASETIDCSGLIVYVYNKAAGIKLPRTIQLMSTKGRSIEGQPPAPGDLVFFNTTGEKYSHAGIYVGQGRFVHAPSAGGTVRLDYITSPYWAAKFTEARRIAP